MTDPDYPASICADCGEKRGRRPCGIATWTMGVCDLCGRPEMVTEPRDYGHLKPTWKDVKHE